jgi:hypothetical protein
VSKYSWKQKIGCGIPIAIFIIAMAWGVLAFQANEAKNELARQAYKEMCREESLLDKENSAKWNKLKADVRSGRIDSKDLDIDTSEYNGPFDSYKSILGDIESISGYDRLFRQKIYLRYRGNKIITMNDIIHINQNFFPDFLSLGFTAPSCYSDIESFDSIVNYHQYKL